MGAAVADDPRRGTRATRGVLARLAARPRPARRGLHLLDEQHPTEGSIVRSNLDGTGVDQSFIGGFSPVLGFGAGAVAVDAKHVYWTQVEGRTGVSGIGRANLDGTGVDYGFISDTGRRTQGIAVDADHVYWTAGDPPRVGRADLDGTNVERSFITMSDYVGIYGGSGVAVDAHHVYWTQVEAPNGVSGIGRANLDGTNVQRSFIPDIYSGATDVAVDAEHIYWTRPSNGAIGRANLDGTNVEPSFISAAGGSTVIASRSTPTTSTGAIWTGVIGPGGVSARHHRPRQPRRHRRESRPPRRAVPVAGWPRGRCPHRRQPYQR